MKKSIQILAIPFAVILVISTLGFSVDRHYCMGMMVEESFYTPADPCSKVNKETGSCSKEHSSGELNMGCCSEESLYINGIFVTSPTNQKPGVPDLILTVSSYFTHSAGIYPPHHYETTFFSTLPRPPSEPGRKILILVQRFLI